MGLEEIIAEFNATGNSRAAQSKFETKESARRPPRGAQTTCLAQFFQ